MYRQGLGDCFLLTFPQKGKPPFHVLIDCGVLVGSAKVMTAVVEHIRDTIREGRQTGNARIDVVVGTHEHKDHLSGFQNCIKLVGRKLVKRQALPSEHGWLRSGSGMTLRSSHRKTERAP